MGQTPHPKRDEVIELALDGKTSKAIAQMLEISRHTVNSIIGHARRRGVQIRRGSRTEGRPIGSLVARPKPANRDRLDHLADLNGETLLEFTSRLLDAAVENDLVGAILDDGGTYDLPTDS